MPPPANGNEYIPFTQLIALEPLSRHIYRSRALAFGPAGGDRTYGGHVFMQAAYAAAQTVGRGWVLHVCLSHSAAIPSSYSVPFSSSPSKFTLHAVLSRCSNISKQSVAVHAIDLSPSSHVHTYLHCSKFTLLPSCRQNITGYFLQAGKASERFIYTVRIIRDGGYSTRGVDVVQESDPAVCFTCICSFKSMVL